LTGEALIVDLGLLGYEQAWAFQKQVWQMRVDEQIPDTLLLVEHPPVITLGKSGKASNLLLPEAELKRRAVELYRVERGGDVTYHGPGQLVGYPIFRLEGALAGVRKYVERLEASLVHSLKTWGISAAVREKLTGVWVGDRKIAAIGVAVRSFVTFHGFALNVNTDLTPFGYIIPCGIPDKGVTSIAREIGHEIPMPGVKHQVIADLGEEFGLEFRPTCRACLEGSTAPRSEPTPHA
jgi:lipoyl(octanoyl) transferase